MTSHTWCAQASRCCEIAAVTVHAASAILTFCLHLQAVLIAERARWTGAHVSSSARWTVETGEAQVVTRLRIA